VGKKPPQSQNGRSHGLIPWTSVGLSPKEQKNKNKKQKINKNYFLIFWFSCWAQAAARSARLPAT
jgi:hypothetical protein